jgi:glycine betaine/proline transport system ATP-binding protein
MYPNQLSGGMQQRVGLARALTTNPDILLMDEAFSALDPLIRSDMQKQLLELQLKLKKTIMFITHDLDEALKLGDKIAILNGGRLVQVGKPEDIIINPADQYVSNFVQDVNRAKVLKVKSIMIDSKQGSEAPKVNMNDSIESCLPIILETRSKLNVVDDNDNIVGSISDMEVAKILKNN